MVAINETELSVVVPVHSGKETLDRLVTSIAKQSLSSERFETIFVINGNFELFDSYFHTVRETYPQLRIATLHSYPPSASHARNIGLRAAAGRVVTFVDDDDWLEPFALETGLNLAGERSVGVIPLKSFSDSGEAKSDQTATRINSSQGTEVSLLKVPWLCSFNACKFIPKWMLDGKAFNTSLRSGEDVAFFSQLLSIEGTKARFADKHAPACAYARLLRPNSISRQKVDFDFSVTQRLEVIADLLSNATERSIVEVQQLINGQAGFVRKFLDENPTQRNAVANAIFSRLGFNFPWEFVNRNAANALAVCFCFVPYSDTSAIVAAKRLREFGCVFDVVSANLSSNRMVDSSAAEICRPYVSTQTILDVPVGFASWDSMASFAESTVREFKKNKRQYDFIYSRAQWAASHLAGAALKLHDPGIRWIAEFSDPLTFDSQGLKRTQPMPPESILPKEIKRAIKSQKVKYSNFSSIFELIEWLTYLLADEIIFTNENQRDEMIRLQSHTSRQSIQKKAVVRAQPVPGAVFTKGDEPDSNTRQKARRFKIGYFGNFYQNRQLQSFREALAIVNRQLGNRVELHVYSGEPRPTVWNHDDNIVWHEKLNYLDFLSTLSLMDTLLVSDTKTSGAFEKNPFLPSKYSDYLSSDTPIFALVEKESTLFHMPEITKASVDDSSDIVRAILNLVQVGRPLN